MVTWSSPSDGDRRVEPAERGVEVGRPDVAAVDDAQRQPRAPRQRVQGRVELLRRAHEVQVELGHGRVARFVEGASEPGEVGREADLEAGPRPALATPPGTRRAPPRCDRAPGTARRAAPRVAPASASASAAPARPASGVEGSSGRGSPLDSSRRVPVPRLPGGRACRGPGPRELGQPLVRPWPERLSGAQLGHQVVVVRVEPLGHLQRRRAGGAAARSEVGVEALASRPPGARGPRPPPGGVEYVVVEAKSPEGITSIPAARRRDPIPPRGAPGALASSASPVRPPSTTRARS